MDRKARERPAVSNTRMAVFVGRMRARHVKWFRARLLLLVQQEDATGIILLLHVLSEQQQLVSADLFSQREFVEVVFGMAPNRGLALISSV